MRILLRYADTDIEELVNMLILKDQHDNTIVVVENNRVIINYPDDVNKKPNTLEVSLMDFEWVPTRRLIAP